MGCDRMDKLILKVLKIVSIICILILFLEGIYLIYYNFSSKDKRTYFDGINSFSYNNDFYITVGSNNDNEKGYEKAKITRYNEKKERVWEKIFNKGYNGAYFGVDFDGDNIVAVGSYEATKKEHKDGVRTALFVKYDSSGKALFEKTFQVLGNSKFSNVLVVDDGYLVVGQSVYENMTLGLSDKGGAFLLKYSKDGKLLWKSNYGGNKSGIYNNLIVLDNYIYAVGKDSTRVGIISKYDMNGNIITTTNYQSTDTVGFTGITSTDGKIFVTGAKKVSDDKNDYDTDAVIVEYDVDCNYIDEVTYKGKGVERYNQILKDVNDDLIVIGTTATYNKSKSTKNNNVFSYDAIIGKYKINLKEISVLQYGDNGDDYFTYVKNIDNDYLVSGYSSYDKDGYLSKFITYSDALKVLEVK